MDFKASLCAALSNASGIEVDQISHMLETPPNPEIGDFALPCFKLAKAKEILAYLVDKQGSGVTRAEVFAAVWEDRQYDRRMQKQMDTYVRSLRETLQEYGISQIMEMEKGVLRVKPDTFSCDAYLFFSGDSDMINAYRGEYMSSYSWANMTEAILSWRKASEN